MSAPASAGGNVFQKWQTNGVDYTTSAATTLTLNADYAVTAIYVGPNRSLSVQSIDPNSGVSITVSPNDTGGNGNGTTTFNRTYSNGTVVSLTALVTVGQKTFQKWQTNGVDYTTSPATSLTMNANYTATAVYASTVVGAYIFYNRSAWDGNNANANASDDGAIATDKTPLLPGGKATFANYTSYSRGINGIMIDISDTAAALTAADFTFKVGNDNNPAGWTTATPPTTIARRVGAGTGGSDRITLIWADGVIKKQWLEVTVLATARTTLGVPYKCYFGNSIGESGDLTTNAQVDVSDENGARIHPRTFLSPAPIDYAYDYDRDKRVDVSDENLARINSTTFLDALKLIDLSSGLLSANRTNPRNIALSSVGVGEATNTQAIMSTDLPLGSDQPILRAVRLSDGGIQVRATGIGGREVQLDGADALVGGTWRQVQSDAVVNAADGSVQWQLPASEGAQFFRLVISGVDR
ncbi:MAG: hypothetical protein U1G07_03720 [Verrucomicrobiota bacterium]